MQPVFNPDDHIRELDDGREYMDIKWRLLWLRSNEPEASIESQVVPSGEDDVICRATISLRSGASVTAHGSARMADTASPVEVAENRALARALAALGYGPEYMDDDEVELQPAPTPPVNLMTARALMEQQEERYESEPEPEAEAEAEAEDLAPETEAPLDEGWDASGDSELTMPVTNNAPQAPEDINWSKFWSWAKPRGYSTAVELSALLDVDVLAHTPGEIRRLIKRYELEHPPGGSD